MSALHPTIALAKPDERPPLPTPTRLRWQPLRLGLVELFHYDCEEFWFRDGHLLLRGNNGTGKSRVLALQLPFLLDGETAPHRVEPDGDPAKRIEWNLLLGKYPDRLGYTWIEFGRREPDGTEHFLTLGCGLRAVEGRPGVDRWFFITPLRVRRDFALQTDQRQPLTHERLAEILAGRGELFREASRYRVAVDRALFGLGERYGPLIELLLRLRQPQLARKLDEKLLSAALSEALTPLRSDLLDSIAESFRGLDADRADLAAQQEIARAVDAFLADYRHYLRIAVRRGAAVVRSAHAAYEDAQRSLRAAEHLLESSTARRTALQGALANATGERAAAEGALKVLQESPEMRGIQALQRARDDAQTKDDARRQTEADLANADQHVRGTAGEESRLAIEAESARTAAKAAAATADRTAHEAALAEAHGEAAGALAAGPPTPAAAAGVRGALDALVRQRREALSHLRRLQQDVTAAAHAHHNALQRLHERDSALREAESAETDARTALAQAVDALLDRYGTWVGACRELVASRAMDLGDRFSEWTERREGSSPLEQALNDARAAATERFAAAQVDLARRRVERDLDAQSVAGEIARLEGGTHTPPSAPPLRVADRTGRAGAPLWRVCDFRPEVEDAERAGLEAALEASGLLDAWLLPDGTLRDLATDDTFLLANPSAIGDSTLARWLLPSLSVDTLETAALTMDTVTHLLGCIGGGIDVGEHWVGPDGSWRLGPLAGHARKLRAEHIGETAREASRQRRLAELRERAAQLDALGATIDAASAALAARRAAADAETLAFPDHEPLRTAGAMLGQSLTAVAQASVVVEKARIAEDEARRTYDVARQRRDADAGDLGLVAWVDRLETLGDAVHSYDLALARLWPALESWGRSTADAARGRELAAQARRRRDDWQARVREARELHDEARGRLAGLLATVGADEHQVLNREAEQRRQVQRLNDAAKHCDDELRQTETTLVRAQADIERYRQERSDRDGARQESFTHLRHLVEHGLVAEAEPTLADDDGMDWPATRLVELARRLEEQLHDAPRDNAAWTEAQSQIYHRVSALDDALVPHGIRSDTSALGEGLVVVRCPFQGRMCRPGEYALALTDDLTHRERLLNQREREVIENHLLGDAAVELQSLLRRAEEWVDETNAELLARPTSTGMQLKFAWEPDPEGPPGLETARRCLRRKNALWTPEDRAGLAAFLQQRIEAEHRRSRSHMARPTRGGAGLSEVAPLLRAAPAEQPMGAAHPAHLRHGLGRRKGARPHHTAVRRRGSALPECGVGRAAPHPARRSIRRDRQRYAREVRRVACDIRSRFRHDERA